MAPAINQWECAKYVSCFMKNYSTMQSFQRKVQGQWDSTLSQRCYSDYLCTGKLGVCPIPNYCKSPGKPGWKRLEKKPKLENGWLIRLVAINSGLLTMGKISYWPGVLSPCTISYSLRARGTNETKWPAYIRPLCISQFQRCLSPPGNRGAFAHVVSPEDGAFEILSRPGGLGISIPRGDPRAFDTCVFERQIDR